MVSVINIGYACNLLGANRSQKTRTGKKLNYCANTNFRNKIKSRTNKRRRLNVNNVQFENVNSKKIEDNIAALTPLYGMPTTMAEVVARSKL